MARRPLMPGSRSSPETLLGARLKASDRSHWLGQVQALQTRLLRRKTMHKLRALVGLLQTPPTTHIDTSGSMWCGVCGGRPQWPDSFSHTTWAAADHQRRCSVHG